MATVGRTYSISTDAVASMLGIEKLPEDVAVAARIAVNAAADYARTKSARRVLQEVNFPAKYVSKAEGRLSVSSRATNSTLTAKVSARQRPTSLARFIVGRPRTGQKGVRVEVKPGAGRFLRSAFPMKLKQGSGSDTNFNAGLAIRTKNGERPNAAYKPTKMRNGLWLLYGPSVSQALLSARNTGIWPDLTADILGYMQDEFIRQLELKNGNG